MIEYIKFENLSVFRKDSELIKAFSICISNGNFVVLTGANGAGKSTFLKTMAGVLEVNIGKIYLNEKQLIDYSKEDRSRLFAYSNSNKIEEEYIRVIDLIALGRYPYLKVNYSETMDNDLIQFYINALGIEHIQYKFLNEVSDGELQKASIARALVQDTPIIIMDEPTAFLDYPSKKLLFSLLRDLAIEKNKIIICATHDVEMASAYGTMFWHLDNKTLQFSDRTIGW